MTGVNASVYDSMDYLPFGAQIAGGTGSTHKFTGKERDSESGLDYFGARFYSSSTGRFASVDRHTATAIRILDPQSWNMYAYTRNLPLVLIDPDGNEWEWAGARNTSNAQGLILGLAMAYMKNGTFQKNFDKVAKSKNTIVKIGDKQLPITQSGPVTSYTPGATSIEKNSLTKDSNGAVIGANNPVHAQENIDVQQSRDHSDLVTDLKHETQHAVQIDSDPVHYANEAVNNKQNSPLETEAQQAGADSSTGAQMTFGDAMKHVMSTLSVTWDDMGLQPTTAEMSVSIEGGGPTQ